jgi:hypothetical protein
VKSPILLTKLQNQLNARQCRSQHIEASEPFRKRPSQPDECGKVVAAACLSFKNTMPVGFIMISGSP